MSESKPPSIVTRFFHACLLILGGIIALAVALELLAQFWGWLALIAGIALMLCAGAWAYRYWWGRR
ncbi:hypothetical protein GCM10010922_03050 [Microbacterium sorbitolivorans]|uniref:Uncharacterized protein n=1 Tax=Microbacterium sorbitolivorans TaxID=1867410 RepID=A0A367Y6P0_9MICO|nr:hypothetical protein [Microbacterium sorbitolivorans]RCK61533.1 hypothetical protein DTO57_02540 [Microbacterium sorbitolivorans]GGF31394.1 hypothetical protein GCM10010922_03050 [Microbacterium sorbitolivorans]